MCKLNKSLYGLKQSGPNWNKMVHDFLTENGFVQNSAEYCADSKQTDKERVILIIRVDDFAASNDQILKRVKDMLRARIKYLGKLRHFLGIDFTQTHGEIQINQKIYITTFFERFDMTRCKPRSTPCEMKMKFDNDVNLLIQRAIVKWLVV